MKLATVRDIKQNFSRHLREMDGQALIVTKNGRPCAGVIGLENKSDVDDFLMANDKKFVDLVRKSARSGFVTLASVERKIAAEERREARRKRRKAA